MSTMTTITYSDLADRIQDTTGMSREAVTDTMDTYIQQIEDIDHTTIDDENIDPDTADFLETAIMAAARGGALGDRELEDLADHMETLTDAKDRYDDELHARDELIRSARRAGARQVDIARITGLTASRIRAITNE